MTAEARREAVYAALPADGSYVAFATVQETVGGGDDVYGVLRDLEAADRAVLSHGQGWRRAGDEPPGFAGDYLTRIDEVIGRAGHAVQAIWPTTESGGAGEAFAYTVGLLDRLGCELVLTGALSPQLQMGLLNDTAALDPFPTARGVPQAHVMQAPYTAVLLDTSARRCADAGYPLSVAHAWWSRRRGERVGDFPVVQVAWPDADYRYPWQDTFGYAGGQPLLADPPPRP